MSSVLAHRSHAAAALALAVALVGFGGPAAAQAGSAGAQRATALVQRAAVEETYAADAVIEAVRSATVSAQISGQVVDILVDAGDRVRRGQLLARIDTRSTDAQLAASRAAIAQAEAAAAQARISLERTRELVTDNFLSKSALDRAEADDKAALAALNAARAGATEAATTRSFAEVRAPIDGVVTRRLVERGELATPGRALLDLHDPSALRAVGGLPQFVVAGTRTIDRAQVELPAGRAQVAATRVTVLPSADPRLLSRTIRADLPAEAIAGQPPLTPGMAAKIHVPIGQSQNLVMPADAVIRRGELTATYVVGADGKALLRQIRVGELLADGRVKVLSGLADGERVQLNPLSAGLAQR